MAGVVNRQRSPGNLEASNTSSLAGDRCTQHTRGHIYRKHPTKPWLLVSSSGSAQLPSRACSFEHLTILHGCRFSCEVLAALRGSSGITDQHNANVPPAIGDERWPGLPRHALADALVVDGQA